MVAFVIKRNDVRGFAPNDGMQPAFGAALRAAAARRVQVLALDCEVEPARLKIRRFVDVLL